MCSASDLGFFTADACRLWRLRLGPPGRAGRPAKAIFRRGAGSAGARASPLGVPACACAVWSAGRYLHLYTYPYGSPHDVKTNLAVWVFFSSTLLTCKLVPGFARPPPAHKHFSLQARIQACPKPDGVHDLEQRRSLREELAPDSTTEACIHSPCSILSCIIYQVWPGAPATTARLERRRRRAVVPHKMKVRSAGIAAGIAPTQQHGHNPTLLVHQPEASQEIANREVTR